MRRVLLPDVPDRAILARPVISEQGMVMVRPGHQLNKQRVAALADLGIQWVFLEEEGTGDVELREPLEALTFARLKEFLRKICSAALGTPEPSLPVKELMRWGEILCDELSGLRDPFALYPIAGSEIDKWISRVINVMVLGVLTTQKVGARVQAQNAAVSAMLLDLGLWRLSPESRRDFWSGRVGREHSSAQHVTYSERIADALGVNAFITAAVAQHHERWDGKGYPRGKSGQNIHPVARVLAVADAYLSLAFRDDNPLLPHDAVEYLMAGVGEEFDHGAVAAFCSLVPIYPVGTEVTLESGERGIVTGVNGPLKNRPRIRVLWDKNGRLASPYEIDLSRENNRFITGRS